jgi:nucleoside-diphosphate-sugar epimerase
MGNMFAIPDETFTLVDPNDIARVAAKTLDALDFKGHSHAYVISDLSGTDEIASLIGKAIGTPDLKWVRIPAEEIKKGLLTYGFADGAADDYVEMFASLDTGLLFEDIQKTKPKIEGTSIEEFAKTWAAAYG